MTKKLISLVSALILLLMSSAHADVKRMPGNFTIRNGVTYQMTKEQILSAEKAYGNKKEPIIREISVWGKDASGKSAGVYTLRYERLTLLGETHDHCFLGYCIDENEKLIGMYQSINSGDRDPVYTESEAKRDYARIRSDLVAKYGKPIGEITNGRGSLLAAHTHLYENADINTYYGTTATCSQWLVQYDDCYCIIELFIREGNSFAKSLGTVDGVCIAYRLVTAQELDELMQDAQQQVNEQYRDI